MEKRLLQNEPHQKRLEVLKDSAEKIESFTYPRYLEPEEIVKIREDYTQNAIKKSKLDEAKKEYMDQFKSDLKPIGNEMKDQMQMIRSKVEEVTEQVYHIADQEEGMMGYYNAQGVLVYQRPLLQNEKQLRIIDNTNSKKSS